MKLYRHANVVPGKNIHDVLTELCAVSTYFSISIIFDFNGNLILIEPGDKSEDVEKAYKDYCGQLVNVSLSCERI